MMQYANNDNQGGGGGLIKKMDKPSSSVIESEPWIYKEGEEQAEDNFQQKKRGWREPGFEIAESDWR